MPAKKTDPRNEAFSYAIGGHLSATHIRKQTFAERCGIRRELLWRWMKQPEVITLGHFRVLVQEAHMTDADILFIVKGNK